MSNLVKVTGKPFNAVCLGCNLLYLFGDKEAHREAIGGWADPSGEAFKAYYCDPCVKRKALDEAERQRKRWVKQYYGKALPLLWLAVLALPARAQRKVYPYSIVPGGVASDGDVRHAEEGNPLVARHYSNLGTMESTAVAFPTHAYVSFLKDGRIKWVAVTLSAGEGLLTDGKHLVRARCGNRVAFTKPPTGAVIPPDQATLPPWADWRTSPPVVTDTLPSPAYVGAPSPEYRRRSEEHTSE